MGIKSRLTDISELRTIAVQFRRAIECVRDDWDHIIDDSDDVSYETASTFRIFTGYPVACCDKSCALLIRYLYELGFTGAYSINGGRRDDLTVRHEWIRIGGVTIDITADQFDLNPRAQAVIVSCNSTWHFRRYKIVGIRAYSQGWTAWHYNRDFVRSLEEFYNVILSQMESASLHLM